MSDSKTPADQHDPIGALVIVGPEGLTRPVGRYHIVLPADGHQWINFFSPDGHAAAERLKTADGIALRFATCPDVALVLNCLERAGMPDALRLDHATPVTRGRCRICTCTMDCACPSGCWWADDSHTLCRQHSAT